MSQARIAITAEDRFSRTFAALRRDIASGQTQLGGLSAAAGTVQRALGALSLGGLAAGGGFGAAFRTLANDLDNLNDAADSTGSTVEKLSALEDVARRNGGGLDLVSTSLLKLNKVLADARPDSPLNETLRRIGLDAAELRRQDPSEALQRIAVALGQYADDGNKARLVQELFGKSTKEVAAFLKDLAAAGELTATTNSEAAAQAEKFNKQIFALQTNASNAGRTLVGELLPALNRTIEAARNGSVFARFFEGLGKDVKVNLLTDKLNGAVRELEVLEGRISFGEKGLERRQKAYRDYIADLQRQLAAGSQALKDFANAADPQSDSSGKRREDRGFVPELKTVGDTAAARVTSQKALTTEAERYLERLQKELEGTQQLTVYQQLLVDLARQRVDGAQVPAVRQQLIDAAKALDLSKQAADAKKSNEQAFDELIAQITKSEAEIDRLFANTATAKRRDIVRQVDLVLKVSRSDPGNDALQRQAGEVLDDLKRQMDALDEAPKPAGESFNALADTIEKSMDRATDAVLDFAIEGKGNLADVGKAFARDIARGMLEEDIRGETKKLARSIADGLKNALKSGDALGSIGDFIKGLFSGSKGFDFSQIISTVGGFFGGGSTGRALGGGVKAGQMVRWQENGREWFVPGSDGTVLNPGQQKALMGAGGGQVVNNTYVTVNGDVSPTTVAAIRAAIETNNAKLVRSMRTGGVYAAG